MRILVTLLLFALTARAQVLVYKNHYTEVITGGSDQGKYPVGGYSVFDVNTGDCVQINSFSSAKAYNTFSLSYGLETFQGKLGKSYTISADSESYTPATNSLFLVYTRVSGVNSSVDIGDDFPAWLIPKTVSYLGNFEWQDENGIGFWEEDSGTLTLDLKTTQNFNSEALTLSDAVSALETMLQAKGFHAL
jgi:hypothetical protein